MKIFAIIVTWNPMKWIDRCLKSLEESTIKVIPIIVDNGSTDGARTYIPSRYTEVVWLPQQNNLGFGQGNNVGIRYAMQNGADYVLLINQDAYLQASALEEMTSVPIEKSLITPLHLSGDGLRLDAMFRESLKRAANQLFDDLLIQKSLNHVYAVGEVCAACWLMPIELIKQVGGFNPLFFQYGEDNNYYSRMVYHGWRISLVPTAQVWHDRVIHGQQSLFQKQLIHIKTLNIVCDLNASGFKRMWRLLKLWIGNPRCGFVEFWKMLQLSFAIKKCREKESLKGTTWL